MFTYVLTEESLVISRGVDLFDLPYLIFLWVNNHFHHISFTDLSKCLGVNTSTNPFFAHHWPLIYREGGYILPQTT